MFFKSCKIQDLMVIVQVSELAIPINLVPKLLHQKRGRKIITFEMTLVICLFLNDDLLVSLCCMEQERVTAQTPSVPLSY